ncbi:MAG: DUF1700 domain-containing protein [Clostridia bacterium]|nr:DUF1700 domain-containing protein [Clostridia bacterium]
MSKQAFLSELRKRLSGLPKDELEERLTFYSDMIDDRVEDGIAEEAAISELGSMDALVSQIIAEVPFSKLVKEKIRPKRKTKAWEIVLLILGSPLWLPLLLAAAAVILAVYVCLWAIIVSLWSAFLSFVVSAFAGIAAGIVLLFRGDGLNALAMIGVGLVCAGLSVFLFYGCKAATKGILKLTKQFALWIKRLFVGKEEK